MARCDEWQRCRRGHAVCVQALAPLVMFAQWKRRSNLGDEPEFTYSDAETWLLKVAIALPVTIVAVLVFVYLARLVARLVVRLCKKAKISPQAKRSPSSEASDSLTPTPPPQQDAL